MVLDIMMPGQDGLSLTEELRGESEVPILLLTARGAPEDRIRGLEAGADDYLPKPFEPRELLLRIATILRRVQAARTDDIVRFGPFTFNRRSAELRRDDDVIHLTTGEISLLQALAAKPGRAISRAELGDKGVVAGLRPGGRRADGAAAAQDRGRPAPAALHPDHARLGLRAAARGLSRAGAACGTSSTAPIVPRSLFWRSLLIVVVPLLILQILLTDHLLQPPLGHGDPLAGLRRRRRGGAARRDDRGGARRRRARDVLIERARRNTDSRSQLEPGVALGARRWRRPAIDTSVGHIDGKILEGFAERLHYPFAVDLADRGSGPRRRLRPDRAGRAASSSVPRKRVTSTTTWLLLAWMVGGSVVLSAIAIYFLRLQVRPIRQLAQAADSFGKGRDVGDFRPRGALEIRQAAHAFNLMRHRILRHISQRTEMLAAVSHDLRTPLTRMQLELELLGAEQDPVLSGLRQDVGEMSKLVEEYLGFARGEGRESVEPTELRPILESMRQRAERSGVALEIAWTGRSCCRCGRPPSIAASATWSTMPAATPAGSASRSSRRTRWSRSRSTTTAPASPRCYREKVFEPFVRLDEQPPGENGGTGLGPDHRARRGAVARRRAAARPVPARRAARRAAHAGLRRDDRRPPVILASRSAARAAAAARRRRRLHHGRGAGRRGRRARRAARPRACRSRMRPWPWPSSRPAASRPGRPTRRSSSAPTSCSRSTATWLEKPVDAAAARAQLLRLRGRRHRLVSAVVAFRGGSRVWHQVDVAAAVAAPVLRRASSTTIWLRPGRASWAASAPTSWRAWARS